MLVFLHIFPLWSPQAVEWRLEGIPFMVLAVHEQIALMSSSQSEMCLLLYVQEQCSMFLHLLCSTIYYKLYTYIYIYMYILFIYIYIYILYFIYIYLYNI